MGSGSFPRSSLHGRRAPSKATRSKFDHNGIAEVLYPFCNARGRIDQIAAQRAQPCWGAVVGGARAVLRSISWARRGNGLDQTLAETEIEQLDVRIDAEL